MPCRVFARHAENVASGVPIIDLDLTPPGAERAPLSWRRRLTPARPVLITAVVLLTLALLGGAASGGRMLSHVLSADPQPAAAFVLSDDSLFTASFGDPAIRRWRLADGELSWTAKLPQTAQDLVYDEASRVLMARSGIDPNVSFLDADTGAVLWHNESPDIAVVTMGGARVLLQTNVAESRRALRLVDARTGRPVWSRVVDSTGYFDPGDYLPGRAPARLIAVDTAGHAVVLQYSDGSVLAEGDLDVDFPAQTNNAFGADYATIATVGDILYVSRRDRGVSTLTAWSIDSVTRRWQVTGGPAGYVVDCGPVICVAEDGLVSALDPADGRVLWQRRGLGIAFRYDDRSLLAYDESENPEAMLLDPRTGAVRLRLGRVVQLGDALLRADSVRIGRNWVEVADDDGVLHVVGALDTAVASRCASRGQYLACATSTGATQVWRIPFHLT